MRRVVLDAFADAHRRPPGTGLHLCDTFDGTPRFVDHREFPERIAGHADFFLDHGVRAGTRVLFPFETTVDTILAFLALIEIGAVPLSVRPFALSTPRKSYQDFLARVAREFRAERVLRVPSLAPVDLPAPPLPLPPGDVRRPGARLRHPHDQELAFVQFSSGSTAFPKGIPVRHGPLRANLAMITRTDGRGRGDRVSSWLPLYHDMGLVGGMLSCFAVGCDLLLADPATFLFDARGWWEHMARERVMGTVIPNFAIDYSLRLMASMTPQECAALDLSGIRAVYLGSEPVNLEHLRAFSALMAPAGLREDAFMPCYGMAEAVLLVSARPPGAGIRTVASPAGVTALSVGRPMPEFTVRIRDERGQVRGEGELGEIEIAGGSLAAGYFDREAPLAAPDGFYATGDIGFVDGGELFVTGRDSDRIKVNGQSLFAVDFEQTLERLPFVRSGRSVVAQRDGRVLVLLEADRTARQDPDGTAERVVAQVVRTLGVAVAPEDVHLLRAGQLPRTSSGKLRRRDAVQAHLRGEFTRPAAERRQSPA
ncbi:AMP-binding protein [Streptomyces bohaiensis]|uniref:AMP-binding protein n=1 Tax=Streptomyces bohaiensis TaxID=1431344 RepID=UPI0028AD6A12|nr:AMP-binding protein [Streptomyces bohaiensis]